MPLCVGEKKKPKQPKAQSEENVIMYKPGQRL